jgi:hypothetical protein
MAALGLALVAAGCREEEEGRPLRHDKGKYQGAPDEPLTADQVERLRMRARRQGP